MKKIGGELKRDNDLKSSWDPVWESVFKSQEWGKYPPIELIRFVARNYYQVPERKKVRILDLGCGTGAATWYLAREGFWVDGIDGSKTAIEIARQRFKEDSLDCDFHVGDFINLDFDDDSFDCLVDINSIQQNTAEYIQIILSEAHRVLKPGGRIFSIMMSDACRFSKRNNPMLDKGVSTYLGKEAVREFFSMFLKFNIERSEYTDRGNLVSNHIISAEK